MEFVPLAQMRHLQDFSLLSHASEHMSVSWQLLPSRSFSNVVIAATFGLSRREAFIAVSDSSSKGVVVGIVALEECLFLCRDALLRISTRDFPSHVIKRAPFLTPFLSES